jgi:phosphate uptake regulator
MVKRDLGFRRIQRTGRGSYIISLPKNWIEDLDLSKGRQLAFELQEDTSLLLTPRHVLEGRKDVDESLRKEYYISVNPETDPESVSRKITSLYVVGADLIKIHFRKGAIPPQHKSALINLQRNALSGSEIVEETKDEIVLQILIKHPDFPVEKAIRRMAILALSANKDAILALEKIDEALIQNAIHSHNDVKRLNLYVVRQLKFGLEQNLFRELGFKTQKEFLGYRIVSNDITSIADNALNLAKNVINLKKMISNDLVWIKTPMDREIYSQVLEFNEEARDFHEASMGTLFKRDYERADKLISEMGKMLQKETDLFTLIFTKKMDPYISSLLGIALEISRKIVDCSRNIAEVTLNRTIEDFNEPINK